MSDEKIRKRSGQYSRIQERGSGVYRGYYNEGYPIPLKYTDLLKLITLDHIKTPIKPHVCFIHGADGFASEKITSRLGRDRVFIRAVSYERLQSSINKIERFYSEPYVKYRVVDPLKVEFKKDYYTHFIVFNFTKSFSEDQQKKLLVKLLEANATQIVLRLNRIDNLSFILEIAIQWKYFTKLFEGNNGQGTTCILEKIDGSWPPN